MEWLKNKTKIGNDILSHNLSSCSIILDSDESPRSPITPKTPKRRNTFGPFSTFPSTQTLNEFLDTVERSNTVSTFQTGTTTSTLASLPSISSPVNKRIPLRRKNAKKQGKKNANKKGKKKAGKHQGILTSGDLRSGILFSGSDVGYIQESQAQSQPTSGFSKIFADALFGRPMTPPMVRGELEDECEGKREVGMGVGVGLGLGVDADELTIASTSVYSRADEGMIMNEDSAVDFGEGVDTHTHTHTHAQQSIDPSPIPATQVKKPKYVMIEIPRVTSLDSGIHIESPSPECGEFECGEVELEDIERMQQGIDEESEEHEDMEDDNEDPWEFEKVVSRLSKDMGGKEIEEKIDHKAADQELEEMSKLLIFEEKSSPVLRAREGVLWDLRRIHGEIDRGTFNIETIDKMIEELEEIVLDMCPFEES